MTDWLPIAEARGISLGTVADLEMPSGRIYRATWKSNGRAIAWWPDDRRRKVPIGLYNPARFRIVAVGIIPDDHPTEGRRRRQA